MPTVKDLLQGAVVGLLIERPGAAKSVEEWIAQLEADEKGVTARALAAKNSQQAQIILRHITGIERWGQQRLRVFLGEALVKDEYEGYRPATDLTTEAQCAAFSSTRHATVDLVRQIVAAKRAEDIKVLHNQLGPITLRGWLRYLDMHANWESKKIR